MNNDYIYRHVYPYEEEYLRRRWGSNPQAVSAAPDYQSGEPMDSASTKLQKNRVVLKHNPTLPRTLKSFQYVLSIGF